MKPSKQATNAWIALNRAQRSIYRKIDAALKQAGFPPLRWYDVLWELDRAGGGLRPIELEKKLLFEQSNLSRLLRRMIDEGLVAEFADASDGRCKMLALTDAGRALRKRMWSAYAPLIHEHIGAAAPAEALESAAETLGAMAKRSG